MKLEQMFGKDWLPELLPFLESKDFKSICKLLLLNDDLNEICPRFVDMFRAFRECPLDKLHTIILGHEPYSGIVKDNNFMEADGLAFSSINSKIPPPYLSAIYSAIDEELFNGLYPQINSSSDLTKWANQGILLLNVSLSNIIHRTNMHLDLWQPFIEFVLRTINNIKKDLVICYIGNEAAEYDEFLDDKSHYSFYCEHPSKAIAEGRKWRTKNMFENVTAYQDATNNITINW